LSGKDIFHPFFGGDQFLQKADPFFQIQFAFLEQQFTRKKVCLEPGFAYAGEKWTNLRAAGN